MPAFLSRLLDFPRRPLGAVVTLVLTLAGCFAFLRSDAFAFWRAQLAAQQDVEAGKLRIYAHGVHPEWSTTYYRLFRERYRVPLAHSTTSRTQ